MTNKLNQILIINGCKERNPRSQRKLYDYYFGYGMKIALPYSKSREEALEIVNDGFLKVFNNLDKFDTEYPFMPWFKRIIVNTAIDYYRKNHDTRLTIDISSIEEFATEEIELPEIFPQDNILPIVQDLPPQYRMVFNLYVMEGYKHSEIATMLDINVSTSKSNLARAKKKLRTAWLLKNNQPIQKNKI